MSSSLFFFNDTATTEIYTLSLHDALPISRRTRSPPCAAAPRRCGRRGPRASGSGGGSPVCRPTRPCGRSEEHTFELQSRQYLVCRLLLDNTVTPVFQAFVVIDARLHIPLL